MKGLINIQNEDNECFRWCLARYLNFVNKNPGKIRNIDSEFVNQPNFKGVKRLLKNRKKNASAVVFGYEDETPYHIYTSKQTFDNYVDYYYYRIINTPIMF